MIISRCVHSAVSAKDFLKWYHVALDAQADISVMHPNLCSELYTTDNWKVVQGINPGDEQVILKTMGFFAGVIPVYISETMPNVLSLAEMESIYEVVYEQSKAFTVTTELGPMRFVRIGCHYVCDAYEFITESAKPTLPGLIDEDYVANNRSGSDDIEAWRDFSGLADHDPASLLNYWNKPSAVPSTDEVFKGTIAQVEAAMEAGVFTGIVEDKSTGELFIPSQSIQEQVTKSIQLTNARGLRMPPVSMGDEQPAALTQDMYEELILLHALGGGSSYPGNRVNSEAGPILNDSTGDSSSSK